MPISVKNVFGRAAQVVEAEAASEVNKSVQGAMKELDELFFNGIIVSECPPEKQLKLRETNVLMLLGAFEAACHHVGMIQDLLSVWDIDECNLTEEMRKRVKPAALEAFRNASMNAGVQHSMNHRIGNGHCPHCPSHKPPSTA